MRTIPDTISQNASFEDRIVPAVNRRQILQSAAGLVLAPGLLACAGYGQRVKTSPFNDMSTAMEVTAGLDLSGKTALVTGCNSGVGYETMRVLALRGAHVLGTARTKQKGEVACSSVKGRCTPLVLELMDFDSVVTCANEVRAMDIPLDIVVCNAGVLFRDHQMVGGLEKHFVVNHLGHHLLVRKLLDEIHAAPESRVVVVGSKSHRNASPGGIRFDDLSGESWVELGYSHSKLANGLFSLELARRFKGTNATSNSLHPGSVATNIFRTAERRSSGRKLKDLAQGAATTCYVATHPALAGVSGYYFSDCNPEEPSDLMQDSEMARKLWDVSEDLVRSHIGSA